MLDIDYFAILKCNQIIGLFIKKKSKKDLIGEKINI